MDQIIVSDANNKTERKKIIALYHNKNEITTVIELFSHIDKYSSIYNKNDMAHWLCDNNSDIIESYLSIYFPKFIFKVSYNNLAKNDTLNPDFRFS